MSDDATKPERQAARFFSEIREQILMLQEEIDHEWQERLPVGARERTLGTLRKAQGNLEGAARVLQADVERLRGGEP